MADSVIRSRVDPKLKAEASQVFGSMGLTMSEAIRLFLVQAVSQKALPFAVMVPNTATQAAIQEAMRGDVEEITLEQMAREFTTVRFESETIDQLDQLAQSLGRPRAWVIKDAVARYLKEETWFRAEVQKGIVAADAGNLVPHDQVKERIRALGVDVD